MIQEKDLEKLDGLEPEHKFCVIERLQRQRLEEAFQYSNQNEPPIFDEFDYMVAVLAAAEEFGVSELTDYKLPWRGDEDWEARCRMFRGHATKVSHRFLLRYGTRNSTVALDAPTKIKISHWLKKMRDLVQQTDVSAEKKDRLFYLIDDLQAEVDRDRTPVHAAGELWMTVCTYLGEGAKKLQPVADFVQQIGSAVGLQRARRQRSDNSQAPKRRRRLRGRRGRRTRSTRTSTTRSPSDKPSVGHAKMSKDYSSIGRRRAVCGLRRA